MKNELLSLMACPNCKNSLALANSEASDGNIVSGELECGSCHSVYLITDGVPDLRPLNQRTDSN